MRRQLLTGKRGVVDSSEPSVVSSLKGSEVIEIISLPTKSGVQRRMGHRIRKNFALLLNHGRWGDWAFRTPIQGCWMMADQHTQYSAIGQERHDSHRRNQWSEFHY